MKRYITKYTENGKLYAEAWDQINIFGKTYTFHRRRIEIPVKQSPMDDALDKFRNVVRGFDKSLFASRKEG